MIDSSSLRRHRSSRFLSLDVLRGLAVFLMIEQHMGVWLWRGPDPGRSALDYPALVFFNALGGGAAPLFVTLAGAGSALFVAAQRPDTDRTLVARGVILLAFGYALNLLTPSWFSWGSWFVLHMMGFAMALAPLWRRLSNRFLLATGVMVLVATVVAQTLLDTPPQLSNPRMRDVSLPGGPLRLAFVESQFPILPWLTFYLAGFVAGRWIRSANYGRIARLGLASAATGAGLAVLGQSGLAWIDSPFWRRAVDLHLGFFPASPAIVCLLLAIPLLAMAAGLAYESRRPLSPTNILVTLGRASLTLLMLHVVLFRELTRPVGLWQACRAETTLLAIFTFVVVSAVASWLWARIDYRGGAEWMLRRGAQALVGARRGGGAKVGLMLLVFGLGCGSAPPDDDRGSDSDPDTDSSDANTDTDTGTGTGTGTGTNGSGSEGGSDDEDACGNAPGQYLQPDMPWNQPIVDAPLAADSSQVVDYLQANVQSAVRFQIDFSLTVLEADASTPRFDFEPTDEHYSPDCDLTPVPVPAGGHLEGETGYECESGGDCHLIVVDRSECRLYEQWRANFAGTDQFAGGCLAVWELDRDYPATLRGDYCTSADAAGLPIAALLFTANEVADGEIRHALRFIVPNANIRADTFVRPGTHATPATSGPLTAPPYAARLRLRADADLSALSAPAQVVARAMQTYGIILADAGNVTFTAASDDFSVAKWDTVGLGPHDLKELQWDDFEMVDTGSPIIWSEGDCTREPLSRLP